MTVTNITDLGQNQIFVFGSNLNGWHAGGAARQAKEKFGAIEGQSRGFQGKSFAIPTLDTKMRKVPLWCICVHLIELRDYAQLTPNKEFLLTPIGTGIAGFTVEEIKSILPDFPENVKLVGDWEK